MVSPDLPAFLSLFIRVSVIPDYAKMQWLVRAPSAKEVLALHERVMACFRSDQFRRFAWSGAHREYVVLQRRQLGARWRPR